MNEIEEFLKRAAAMRARQQQAAGAPRPATPPAPTPPPARAPLAPLTNRLPQSSVRDLEPIEEAEVIEADAVSGDDVAADVERHLDVSGFRDHISHLGESIKSSDEAIEAHLHQTFEHRLGTLGGRTETAEDSTLDDDENAAKTGPVRASTAADLREQIRSPGQIRNLIILSEILTPPHDRW